MLEDGDNGHFDLGMVVTYSTWGHNTTRKPDFSPLKYIDLHWT